MISTVDSLDAFKRIIAENPHKYILIKFYAPWCGPCKIMEPVFKNAIHELYTQDSLQHYADSIICVEINKDTAQDIITYLSLDAFTIPHFYIARIQDITHNPITDLGGTQSKTRLIEQITHYIDS